MTLGDGAMDALLIVGSLTGECGEWTWDLVEQGPDLRTIIDVAGRQLGSIDLCPPRFG